MSTHGTIAPLEAPPTTTRAPAPEPKPDPTQYVVLARDAEPSDTSRWTMVPGIFDGPRRKALEAAYTALGASDRAMLAAVPLRSWAPEPVGVEVNRKVVFG